jgi:7-cyano-7-deazaguanine synthase in queuosine biosynthesis
VTAKEYIIEFSTVEQSTLFLKENEEYIQNVRYNFDSDILIGTAIEFKEDTVAKRILVEYPSITRYWPIQHHIRQQAPIPQHHHDNHAVVPNFFVPQNNVIIYNLEFGRIYYS